jgi:hypothetical protein
MVVDNFSFLQNFAFGIINVLIGSQRNFDSVVFHVLPFDDATKGNNEG